jgi:two-component system, LytTR family, sensor kinase
MFAAIRFRLSRMSLFWRLQLMGWGACAVIGFCLRMIFFADTRGALSLTLFQEPLGLLLSCGLRASYRRLLMGQGISARSGFHALALSLLASLVEVGCVQLVMQALGLTATRWFLVEGLAFRVAVYWLLFASWSFLYLWLKSEFRARAEQARAAEASAAALRSELQLLRAQLDPHFLFNALNGISAEIPVHPQTALSMLRELSDYLRFSLEHRDVAVVSLDAELEAMAGYLRIEQTRFGERLQVRIDAERSALRRSIPTFLLQPLVENAIKHAMHTSESPWELAIEASADGDTVQVRVRNTGALTSAGKNGTGVGLPLLRRRLELLYPQRHRFSLIEQDGSVCAELNLKGGPCSA